MRQGRFCATFHIGTLCWRSAIHGVNSRVSQHKGTFVPV
ncbi:hypothetical protein M1M34_gp127 [Haloarcula tailed virus 2]|uniref:Uncharacterized protein n=1 Tax=Haloarcula tailed virus 2 TaxID=2877989 RepID=A0AAE8XZB8_9CAUD|nr:hypothetical protein M1M34_gp127 [Haloarcula tailed virus 2]UBF23206.1 hypothetical protein HATV-2_gp55 [Haloarcula tailed virus 2]